MKILFLYLIAMGAFFLASKSYGETHEVSQLNKDFTIKNMEINVGDSVKFVNNDPFFHNVFSLSDAALFDLGSYPQGEFKIITFDEAGEVDIECAIHPNMKMKIVVK